MMSPLLNTLRYEDPDLLELIHFLRAALPRSGLSRRQWLKPAARYAILWKWVISKGLEGVNRKEVIVTRTAVYLRVHAD
jgi:hypothetical protein